MRSSASARRRRPRPNWKTRLAVAAAALAAAVLGWAALARATAPEGNTDRNRFDAIVVLGAPADGDGNPTPKMLARVTEAVREYERGAAPRLIVSGGAEKNRSVEAQVMARVAEAQGIPESAVVEEPRALNTIENACYTAKLMKANGWSSAEVVTSTARLPRAGMIWSRTPEAQWRMHAAPALSSEPAVLRWVNTAMETLKTAHYLIWERQRDRCQP